MKNKLILSISIVLIILSLLLCIKTAADKREINKYKQGQFSYADFGNGIVELTMASGEVVRLCFDKNSVKAERSYKVKDRAEQVYLIAFVYFYGRKTDIKIERSVTDMLGELRLKSKSTAKKKRSAFRENTARTRCTLNLSGLCEKTLQIRWC